MGSLVRLAILTVGGSCAAILAACGLGVVGEGVGGDATDASDGGAELSPEASSQTIAGDGATKPTPASPGVTIAFEAAAPVNLTDEGTLDWAKWGHSDHPIVRKAAGGSLLSPWSNSSGGMPGVNDVFWDQPESWTDGDDPASGSDDKTYAYVTEAQTSTKVTWTIPAVGGELRTLTLYLGAAAVKTSAAASLDDGTPSPAPVTQDTTSFTLSRLVVTFAPTAATATLTVTWTVTQTHSSGSSSSGWSSSSSGGGGLPASVGFASATLRGT